METNQQKTLIKPEIELIENHNEIEVNIEQVEEMHEVEGEYNEEYEGEYEQIEEIDDEEADFLAISKHNAQEGSTIAPQIAQDAVFVHSNDSIIDKSHIVKGYDFNEGVDYKKLLDSFMTTGFQATHFGRAVQHVNKMLAWRLSDDPINPNDDDYYFDEEVRKNTRCTVFLSYTSNMISSGNRESIRFLAEHNLVNVIVTTTGGIEEDFMKCMDNTYVGDFEVPGDYLRKNGVNRIGNLLIPNDNYVKLEEWVIPILDSMLEEQRKKGKIWTPSKFIKRLGKEINDERSVYYWCYKNKIPVFCPSLTDGALGDIIYFHSYQNPGLIIDIAQDVRKINSIAVKSKKTGVIILGGGVIKHHVLNANLMRNGADFSVYINTANEFDGSDSGARPDEAKSWGKIKLDVEAVKIFADATIIFPLLVAQTFAPYYYEHLKKDEQ